MIILGVILLVVGLLISIPIIWYIGIALILIGLILALVGGVGGRPVGGRAHWW